MKGFKVVLQDAIHSETLTDVSTFVGEDASGSFGILAGHARLMTSLVIGLARLRVGQGEWQYLAVPGALLYFHNNVLILSTRHYLLDNDYMRISAALQQQLLEEEKKLKNVKDSLHRMEEEVLRRMWELGRSGG
ncbi:F0F1 ATP synthase subunit epsilon [Kaarinaea lacus]